MSSNVLILAPRLDVPFKNFGPVSSMRGPIEPIRVHWKNFIDQHQQTHARNGDKVIVIERPLWQFDVDETNALIDTYDIDFVYIPHRESATFPITKAVPVYYMQTVFPWKFYVDPQGYAGGSTLYDMDVSEGNPDSDWFSVLRKYALSGKSKFSQPKGGAWNPQENYFLFTCQLPHDHTIKYHSDFTVEECLEDACVQAAMSGKKLIVKGHVISRDSMKPLKDITDKYENATWIEDINIHDLIRKSDGVITVNSGTGMESLLHLKPVATYGRAEYDIATKRVYPLLKYDLNRSLLTEFLAKPTIDENLVKKMFDIWCERTYDTKYETLDHY